MCLEGVSGALLPGSTNSNAAAFQLQPGAGGNVSICETVRRFEDIRHEHFQGALSWEDAKHLARVMNCTPLERAWIESDRFRLLCGRHQQETWIMAWGQGQTTNRGGHCLHALYLAIRMSQILGFARPDERLEQVLLPCPEDRAEGRRNRSENLRRRLAQKLRLAALLHDDGHTAFSHFGEGLINHLRRRYGYTKEAFHHEKNTAAQLRRHLPGFLEDKTLNPHGIRTSEILNVLRCRSTFHALVKEIDRWSYLILGTLGSTCAEWYKRTVPYLVERDMQNYRYDNGVGLYVTDTEPARAKILLVLKDFKLSCMHAAPRAAADFFISRSLRGLIAPGTFNTPKTVERLLIESTDREVLNRFPLRTRKILEGGNAEEHLEFFLCVSARHAQ